MGEDPRATCEKMLNRPKITVWCGMISERIVGLEGRMREVMSSIPQEFLAKSVDAVHSRLEKLVVNDGALIEF